MDRLQSDVLPGHGLGNNDEPRSPLSAKLVINLGLNELNDKHTREALVLSELLFLPNHSLSPEDTENS